MAQETIFAKGIKFLLSASSLDISMTPAAPSLIPDEFPAVTVPFSLKTVFNDNKLFKVTSGLGCSSFSIKLLINSFLNLLPFNAF